MRRNRYTDQVSENTKQGSCQLQKKNKAKNRILILCILENKNYLVIILTLNDDLTKKFHNYMEGIGRTIKELASQVQLHACCQLLRKLQQDDHLSPRVWGNLDNITRP